MCSKCIKLDNLVVQMKTYRPDCYRKNPKNHGEERRKGKWQKWTKPGANLNGSPMTYSNG